MSSSDAREDRERTLETLLDEHSETLWAWLVLRLGTTPRRLVDIDDIFQETWCRAFGASDRFDPSAPFRPWILGIARNVLRETLREAARHKERSFESRFGESVALSRIAGRASSASRKLMRAETMNRLRDVLATLDEEERRIILLHGIESNSLNDVADHIGLTRDAVKKRWQRSKQRLIDAGVPNTLFDR